MAVRHLFLRKTLALVLALALVDGGAWAQVAAGLRDRGRPPQTSRLSPDIPPPLRAILEDRESSRLLTLSVYRRPSSPERGTVLLIQDPHLHPEAQKNLAQFLSRALRGNDVDAVFLEGAWGQVDFTPFQKQAPADLLQRVADQLLSDGRLSGPAHAGLLTPTFVPWIGIEDKALYIAHLTHARKARATQDEALDFINTLRKPLETRIKNWNPSLQTFHRSLARSGHSAGSARLTHLLESPPALDPRRFPQLDALKKILSDGRTFPSEPNPEIQWPALLDDMRRREENIYQALARTPQERSETTTWFNLRLTEGLVRLALTPQEWAAYEKMKTPVLPPGIARPYEDFYRLACQRNTAFTQHLLARAGKNNILVVGGFHGEAIRSDLLKGGWGVLLATPATRMTGVSLPQREGGGKPLDTLLNENTLAPPVWSTPRRTLTAGLVALLLATSSQSPHLGEKLFHSIMGPQIACRVNANATCLATDQVIVSLGSHSSDLEYALTQTPGRSRRGFLKKPTLTKVQKTWRRGRKFWRRTVFKNLHCLEAASGVVFFCLNFWGTDLPRGRGLKLAWQFLSGTVQPHSDTVPIYLTTSQGLGHPRARLNRTAAEALGLWHPTSYMLPLVTVEGERCVVFRVRPNGEWALLGGHQTVGDPSPLTTATTEVKEELNLAVSPRKLQLLGGGKLFEQRRLTEKQSYPSHHLATLYGWRLDEGESKKLMRFHDQLRNTPPSQGEVQKLHLVPLGQLRHWLRDGSPLGDADSQTAHWTTQGENETAKAPGWLIKLLREPTSEQTTLLDEMATLEVPPSWTSQEDGQETPRPSSSPGKVIWQGWMATIERTALHLQVWAMGWEPGGWWSVLIDHGAQNPWAVFMSGLSLKGLIALAGITQESSLLRSRDFFKRWKQNPDLLWVEKENRNPLYTEDLQTLNILLELWIREKRPLRVKIKDHSLPLTRILGTVIGKKTGDIRFFLEVSLENQGSSGKIFQEYSFGYEGYRKILKRLNNKFELRDPLAKKPMPLNGGEKKVTEKPIFSPKQNEQAQRLIPNPDQDLEDNILLPPFYLSARQRTALIISLDVLFPRGNSVLQMDAKEKLTQWKQLGRPLWLYAPRLTPQEIQTLLSEHGLLDFFPNNQRIHRKVVLWGEWKTDGVNPKNVTHLNDMLEQRGHNNSNLKIYFSFLLTRLIHPYGLFPNLHSFQISRLLSGEPPNRAEESPLVQAPPLRTLGVLLSDIFSDFNGHIHFNHARLAPVFKNIFQAIGSNKTPKLSREFEGSSFKTLINLLERHGLIQESKGSSQDPPLTYLGIDFFKSLQAVAQSFSKTDQGLNEDAKRSERMFKFLFSKPLKLKILGALAVKNEPVLFEALCNSLVEKHSQFAGAKNQLEQEKARSDFRKIMMGTLLDLWREGWVTPQSFQPGGPIYYTLQRDETPLPESGKFPLFLPQLLGFKDVVVITRDAGLYGASSQAIPGFNGDQPVQCLLLPGGECPVPPSWVTEDSKVAEALTRGPVNASDLWWLAATALGLVGLSVYQTGGAEVLGTLLLPFLAVSLAILVHESGHLLEAWARGINSLPLTWTGRGWRSRVSVIGASGWSGIAASAGGGMLSAWLIPGEAGILMAMAHLALALMPTDWRDVVKEVPQEKMLGLIRKLKKVGFILRAV